MPEFMEHASRTVPAYLPWTARLDVALTAIDHHLMPCIQPLQGKALMGIHGAFDALTSLHRTTNRPPL